MLLMVAASGAKAMPRFADLPCEDVETGAQGKPVVVTMLAPMWKLSKMDGIVSSFPLMMRLSFRRHHDSSRPRMRMGEERARRSNYFSLERWLEETFASMAG